MTLVVKFNVIQWVSYKLARFNDTILKWGCPLHDPEWTTFHIDKWMQVNIMQFRRYYSIFKMLLLSPDILDTIKYYTLLIGMELIGAYYRVLAGIMICYFFALGYVLLAGIAYLSRNWVYTQIATSTPAFLFLSYYW